MLQSELYSYIKASGAITSNRLGDVISTPPHTHTAPPASAAGQGGLKVLRVVPTEC